eukprot:185809-Amphidinium_carterae.2
MTFLPLQLCLDLVSTMCFSTTVLLKHLSLESCGLLAVFVDPRDVAWHGSFLDRHRRSQQWLHAKMSKKVIVFGGLGQLGHSSSPEQSVGGESAKKERHSLGLSRSPLLIWQALKHIIQA